MKISLSFVPDGNRRWAKENNTITLKGHIAGVKKIQEIMKWVHQEVTEVDECFFWCLSRSNLERDQKELDGIFTLLKHYFETMRKNLIKHQIAFLAL